MHVSAADISRPRLACFNSLALSGEVCDSSNHLGLSTNTEQNEPVADSTNIEQNEPVADSTNIEPNEPVADDLLELRRCLV